jgi:hypothetical protein
MLHFQEFDGFEFLDLTGQIRTIYGCSSIGIFEFYQRLSQLHTLLTAAPAETNWQELYLSNKQFAHCLQRCLILNGIDPDWVTLDQVHKLLFPHETVQGWEEAILVAINAPRTSAPRTAEPATLGEVVGAIATHTTLDKALELAQTVPAKQLQAIMKAKVDAEKAAVDGGKKERQKSDRAKAKAQLEAMRERLVG